PRPRARAVARWLFPRPWQDLPMKARCLLVALAVVLACLALPQLARADGPLSFEFPLSPVQLRGPAPAGQRLITDDDLPLFAVKISTIVGWQDDEHFLQLKNGQLFAVSASPGQARRVTNPETWQRALAALPARDDDVAGPFARPQKGGKGNTPTSPDGKWTGSVRGGNLYVVNKETKVEKQLTKDGSNLIRNGKADWVYMEELYGRGNLQTFWW